jgi:tyrosyl-tRNA synthetase
MKFNRFPQVFSLPNRKLRIKFGIDPTSDKIHLGHLVPLQLLKEFKDEGHQIDIILGTFTAQMGDPSGKNSMRPILSPDETKANAESIISQLTRVLGEGFNIHFNHTWFDKMTMPEMMSILSKFNVGNLLDRDSFKQRMNVSNPIGMHELIVPILQGFDSVHLKSDVEIGGSDQLFNFKISRQMQELFGQEPENCFLMPIINGADGRKMSKSLNNCIFINDVPEDVFGKTMSISDTLMFEWLPIFFNEFDDKLHPVKLKKMLSHKITELIWGIELADKAQNHFESVIQGNELPENITEFVNDSIVNLVKIIRKSSTTEARRLLKSNAVKVNGQVANESTILNIDDIIKIGKKDFGKVK